MRRGIVLLVGFVLLAAACGNGSDSGGDSAGGGAPSYLFVVDAASGAVDGDTITLSGVDSDVLQFTDRPYRRVGYVGIDDFAQTWDEDGFTDDPPDAAISWIEDGDTMSTAIELTSFVADDDSVILTFNDLDDTNLLGGDQQVSLPVDFTNVSIVIDSASSAPESEQIELNVQTTTSDSVTIAYAGINGNEPASFGNTIFVWEGTVVGWNDPPVATMAIDSDTTDGSVTISGLTPDSTPYTIGYAVSGSPSSVASTATILPDIPTPDTDQTDISIISVGSSSVGVSYQLPAGTNPSANGHWVGVWEGSSIDLGGSNRPITRTNISNSAPAGTVEISNFNVLRGVQYTVGYFVGANQSELAAAVTFVN